MSPHIDLDPDIFDYLKANAEPFADTPSTVLRRLLGLSQPEAAAAPVALTDALLSQTHTTQVPRAKKRRTKATPIRTRAASGTLLAENRYELPLLKALVDSGGQAPYRDVVDAVGRELKDDLMPADFENLNSGGIRWQSRLQFVRLRLIERGYLDKDSPRGVWRITNQGRAALAEGERA